MGAPPFSPSRVFHGDIQDMRGCQPSRTVSARRPLTQQQHCIKQTTENKSKSGSVDQLRAVDTTRVRDGARIATFADRLPV